MTSTTVRAAPKPVPRWADEGWMPVIVEACHRIEDWFWVEIEILERRDYITVLSADLVHIPARACASFDGFGPEGYGMLAILDLDAPDAPKMIEVYQKDRFDGRSAADSRDARNRLSAPR